MPNHLTTTSNVKPNPHHSQEKSVVPKTDMIYSIQTDVETEGEEKNIKIFIAFTGDLDPITKRPIMMLVKHTMDTYVYMLITDSNARQTDRQRDRYSRFNRYRTPFVMSEDEEASLEEVCKNPFKSSGIVSNRDRKALTKDERENWIEDEQRRIDAATLAHSRNQKDLAKRHDTSESSNSLVGSI